VRKSLFFASCFILFAAFFSFYGISTADAAAKAQLCGREFDGEGNLIQDHGACDAPLTCEKVEPDNNLNPETRCFEQKAVTCTCNPNNAAQSGQNGYTCTGAPAGYCPAATQRCDPGGFLNYVNFPPARDTANGIHYTFNGIHCTEDRRVGPGEECAGKDCQTPVDNKNYSCQLDRINLGPDGIPYKYTCQEKGNEAGCPKKGEGCNLIAAPDGGCCALDEDNKTPLACDINTDKCAVQSEIQCKPEQKNSPACHECAKENEECGFQADGRTAFVTENCCTATQGNMTLSCVDGANALVEMGSKKGTCKFRDNSAPLPDTVTVPPLPPVAPPPCAPGKLINGSVCTAFLTALGEINTDTGSFITNLFALLLAASGGIAILLLMRAGYTIMTSAGNPEKVKTGQEQFVAAIVGLLFIIFSFVILQVIGVDILRLPEFTEQVQGPGNNPGAPAPDHCNSCETANACNARGGTSRGILDCGIGQVCCE
jgi:hypothetical protein